jgi:membrane protease YdiL (CAAX protease family)
MRRSVTLIFGNSEFVQRSEWRWWSGLLAGTLTFLVTTIIGFWVVFTSTVGRVSDLGFLTMELIGQFLLIITLIFLATQADSDRLSKLYLIRVNLRSAWVIAFIVIALGVWCTGIIWDTLFPDALKGDGLETDEDLLAADTRLAALALVVIGAPIAEELLFRGFMLPPLAKTRLGFWGAALVTTLLWTAIHLRSWQGSLLLTVWGLALSYLLWRTGSILPSIALHGLLNVIYVFSVLD